jgi:PIN domain nuclease of toxin-antitoxin system
VSRALIDTHVLLWWLVDDPSLSRDARKAIGDVDEALISSASVWEIAIKRSLGKLAAPDDLLDVIGSEGFSWLPVTAEHAWEVTTLPPHHGDPFDRLLIAQARVEDVAIVTADRRFDLYAVGVRW